MVVARRPDEEVHVRDRRHPGDGGEDDNEACDQVAAQDGSDEVGEDEVQDVAAADELVAGDCGIGQDDGHDAEDAGGLAVAGFEQVGDGELGELAGAGRDKVDEQQPGPSSGALPERDEAVVVGVLPRRPAANRSRSNWRAA